MGAPNKKWLSIIRRSHERNLSHALLLICLTLIAPVFFVINAEAEDRCAEVVKTLEQNTLRLKEYVTALHNAHRERNFHMAPLLNSEIDETLKQIRVGEAELLNCPAVTGATGPGLSSVKSQDTKFAEVNCDELKKKHIQLSRKFNSLARRRQSTLSELTNEEKIEFRETEDSLNAVDSELKKRCRPAQPPKPFQRRPQPAGGSFR
ncbi:MAG: hypothetical protein V1897_08940 [Pseudomonadota bacterium]